MATKSSSVDRYNQRIRDERDRVIVVIRELNPSLTVEVLEREGKEGGNSRLYDIRNACQLLNSIK